MQEATKKLHKIKFQAGLGKADLIEQRKTKQKEVKDLVIPNITGAIHFKKWFGAVSTKNRHLTSSAAKRNFVVALKPTVQIPNIKSSIERMESVAEIVNLVKQEAGGFHNLVEDCIKLIQNLKIPHLASTKKLFIDKQIEGVNIGLEVFASFEGNLEEMPDRLIKCLKNDILTYRWRADLEERITHQTLNQDQSSSIFLRDILRPGALETSFNLTVGAARDADSDEPDELNGDVDANKLNETRKKTLYTIYFTFLEARDKLQQIRGEANRSDFVAYNKFFNPAAKSNEKLLYTQENHEHQDCCESEEEEDEFDGGENRMLFTQTQLEEDKKEALELAQIMIEEWKKSAALKSPHFQNQMKKSELGCELEEHPYASLRFCPRILAKSPNEIADIIKKLQRKKCTRCLSNATDKHNSLKCILGRYGCATCFRKGESKEVQSTHLSWNCRKYPGVAERLASAKAMKSESEEVDSRKHKVLLAQEHNAQPQESSEPEEEKEESTEAEDYSDSRFLLYTNQIIQEDWFDDAEHYPVSQIENYPWGRPETPTTDQPEMQPLPAEEDSSTTPPEPMFDSSTTPPEPMFYTNTLPGFLDTAPPELLLNDITPQAKLKKTLSGTINYFQSALHHCKMSGELLSKCKQRRGGQIGLSQGIHKSDFKGRQNTQINLGDLIWGTGKGLKKLCSLFVAMTMIVAFLKIFKPEILEEAKTLKFKEHEISFGPYHSLTNPFHTKLAPSLEYLRKKLGIHTCVPHSSPRRPPREISSHICQDKQEGQNFTPHELDRRDNPDNRPPPKKHPADNKKGEITTKTAPQLTCPKSKTPGPSQLIALQHNSQKIITPAAGRPVTIVRSCPFYDTDTNLFSKIHPLRHDPISRTPALTPYDIATISAKIKLT